MYYNNLTVLSLGTVRAHSIQVHVESPYLTMHSSRDTLVKDGHTSWFFLSLLPSPPRRYRTHGTPRSRALCSKYDEYQIDCVAERDSVYNRSKNRVHTHNAMTCRAGSANGENTNGISRTGRPPPPPYAWRFSYLFF